MSNASGLRQRARFSLESARLITFASAFALFLSGCSADVARFDSTSFEFDPAEGDGPSPPPVPSEPVNHSELHGNAVARSTPPGPYGAGAVDVAALPEPAPARVEPIAMQPRRFGSPEPQRFAAAPAAEPVARGEPVEVQPGDTLYGLSKRHRVPLAELMSANGLSGTALKPGQKLYLPAGSHAAAVPSARRIETAAVTPAEPPSAEVMQKYGAIYTVKAGDSLYAIARAHGAPYKELQQVNGIKDVRKVRPGVVLKVPGAAAIAEAPPLPAPDSASTSAPAKVINGEQVAALNDRTTDASPEPLPPAKLETKDGRVRLAVAAPQSSAQSVDRVTLRWPAQGKIIAGFGGRPDGTHNDGINISTPLGTDVHAAESGVVAYAGSELKGYGNLILVRHDNGWVTAYAHADEMLVKRGDKVRRGQVIAKACKTGAVDQPQVHFELRQGPKPVDPTPYLE